MTIPTISPLPDPSTTSIDDFVAALETMRTQANAMAAYIDTLLDGTGAFSEITVNGVGPGPYVKVHGDAINRPTFTEYSKVGFNAKGAVGALGSFEMNMSLNMDYSTGVHRYYDSTKNALWFTMGFNGLYLQYSPSGFGGGDIWYGQGSQLPWQVAVNGYEQLIGPSQAVTDHWDDAGLTGATMLLKDKASTGNADKGGTLLFGAGRGNFAFIHGAIQSSAGPSGDLLFGTRGTSGNILTRMRLTGQGVLNMTYMPALADGDKYVTVDANGNFHRSAQGPTS